MVWRWDIRGSSAAILLVTSKTVCFSYSYISVFWTEYTKLQLFNPNVEVSYYYMLWDLDTNSMVLLFKTFVFKKKPLIMFKDNLFNKSPSRKGGWDTFSP